MIRSRSQCFNFSLLQNITGLVDDNGIPLPLLDMADNIEEETREELVDDLCLPVILPKRAINRISVAIVAKLLSGQKPDPDTHVILVDCRFKYEYSGGHIISAVNLIKKEQMIDLYEKYRGKKCIFIFHCEFSSERGPTWANAFRDLDRTRHHWPNLEYKDLYIMDGGFREFYDKYPELCVGTYIRMEEDGTKDKSLLKVCNHVFKSEVKQQSGPTTPPIVRKSDSFSIDWNCFVDYNGAQ